MLDAVVHAFPQLYVHMVTYFLFFIFVWIQFETDYVVESTLSLSDELFNTKYKDKLEPTYKVLNKVNVEVWTFCY